MTWLYIPCKSSRSVPEPECLTKGSDSLTHRLARCVWRNGKDISPRSWSAVCKKETWTKLLSGLTLSPSTANLGAEKWISSLADTHVNHSVKSENVEVSPTLDTSGRTSPEL